MVTTTGWTTEVAEELIAHEGALREIDRAEVAVTAATAAKNDGLRCVPKRNDLAASAEAIHGVSRATLRQARLDGLGESHADRYVGRPRRCLLSKSSAENDNTEKEDKPPHATLPF
jgi:hypothetical protein